MKVTELKDELELRREGKSGNTARLRRRLHAAFLFCALSARPPSHPFP